MAMLLTVGLLSVAWTAYELGRSAAGPAPKRARAWDAQGRPVRIVEVLPPERPARRLQRAA